MIENDRELTATRQRIGYFLDLLARLRIGSHPDELSLVTSGYRAEIERMQREMLDAKRSFLRLHPDSGPIPLGCCLFLTAGKTWPI